MKINEFIPNTSIYSIVNSPEKGVKEEKSSVGFAEALKNKLNEVNDKQLESESVTEQFIKGEDVPVHEVMMKAEEAKLSLQLAVEIRNKLMEAYQELNRTQV
ncbi:flagellar hook-basal body complex protein FliE [Clostridium sp. ZS2-4]|uniref:flagellar hook-basal body complex protein FliE n=1 Tax=Clostridium sp. ZS2-4 TaxID=2987703 RepID=UPI00227B6E4D|nr:flagellar hook-basal body complex protein FliE [Clostridium sp. ZS2-4]MCY6353999.1 flagellar hook-basal body complex protein FliE [Clostridium sp. ZS2-4]